MTIDEANEIAAALIYKPGWGIELSQRGGDLELRMSMLVPDSRTAAGESIQVRANKTIDLRYLCLFDENQFVNWVFDQIMRLERHEAQEWFRLRGELVDDPHADDRT